MMSFLAGAVTDEMLGVGKQRGRAVQRDEMSIGYNEIEVGVGVDQFTGGVAVVDALAAVATRRCRRWDRSSRLMGRHVAAAH